MMPSRHFILYYSDYLRVIYVDTLAKSIMKPHQMSFGHTLLPVVPLTVLQSWSIKLLANRKGTLIFSIYMRKVRITYIMVTIDLHTSNLLTKSLSIMP